jgi:hypothetical protein
LFHEPVEIARPELTGADNRLADQYDPKATPEMFSTGAKPDGNREPLRITGEEIPGFTQAKRKVLPNGKRDFGAMRRVVRDWAKANLVGESFLNDYSGKSVIVTSAGIDHGLTNRASIDQMAATHALPELIKAARVTTVPDTEGRSDIVAIHRLDSQITVGGRQYAARMTVYENKDGDWLYAYRLRKERGSQGNAAGPLELRPLRSSDDTIVPSSPPVKENPAVGSTLASAMEALRAHIPDARPVEPATAVQRTIAELAGRTGKTLVVVRSKQPFRGVVHEKHPDVIFIHEKNRDPAQLRDVLAHELIHTLDDATRMALRGTIDPMELADGEMEYRRNYARAFGEEAAGRLSPGLLAEESLAVVMGRTFTLPHNWRKLVNAQPRAINAVNDAIGELQNRLGGRMGRVTGLLQAMDKAISQAKSTAGAKLGESRPSGTPKTVPGAIGIAADLKNRPDRKIIIVNREFSGSREARRLFASKAAAELVNDPPTNKDTGWKIAFSRRSLQKALSDSSLLKSATDDHFEAAKSLRALVEEGVLGESHTDKKRSGGPDPNIKAIHRFYAPLQVDDKLYRVKLTVKEFNHPKELGKSFYTHELTDIETPARNRAASYPDGLTSAPHAGVQTISVAELLRGVNSESGEPLIKAGQSHVEFSPSPGTPGEGWGTAFTVFQWCKWLICIYLSILVLF